MALQSSYNMLRQKFLEGVLSEIMKSVLDSKGRNRNEIFDEWSS